MAKLKRWGRELLLLALIALAVVTVMDWLNAAGAAGLRCSDPDHAGWRARVVGAAQP